MKQFSVYSLFLFVFVFSLSCTLQDHVQPSVSDVYVSGYEQTDTAYTAKYWKNGQPVNLMISSKQVKANSIAVSGSDVYVVGFQGDSAGKGVATYWKNGVLEDFSKDVSASILNDVEVVGSDVYVAGEGFEGFQYFGAYWKNGVSVKLPGQSYAKSIAVSGSDVYVAGMIWKDGRQVATYWKNGVKVELTHGAGDAFANAIAISGNEVLVVGWEYVNGTKVSRYWKDGVELGILANKSVSEATDITVSNSTYIVGQEAGFAFYWNNVIRNINNAISTSGIKVVNGDRYISGGMWNGSKNVAKYWKNDTEMVLSDGTANAFTTSIFVTKP